MKESERNQNLASPKQWCTFIGKWQIFSKYGLVVFSAALGIFLPRLAKSAEIHLEHSFAIREGAGWGTDDTFRRKLNLPESLVPDEFKIAATSNQPYFYQTSGAHTRVFQNQEVALFTNLKVCIDKTLPQPTAQLGLAFANFAEKINGPSNSSDSLFKIQWAWLDLSHDSRIAAAEHCDAIVKKGSWSAFPYQVFRDEALSTPSGWQNQVFGVFYRHDKKTIPVISLNPDVNIDYAQSHYTEVHGTHVSVDGRTLILHELGHVLGFAHIDWEEASHAGVAATIMGVNESNRSDSELRLRYVVAQDLWQHADLYQVSMYRRMLYRYQLWMNSGKANPKPILKTGRDELSFCLPLGAEFDLVTAPFPKPSGSSFKDLQDFYSGPHLFTSMPVKPEDCIDPNNYRHFVFEPVPGFLIRIEGMAGADQFEFKSVRIVEIGDQIQVWVKVKASGTLSMEKNVGLGLRVWVNHVYMGENPHSVFMYPTRSVSQCLN